MNRDRTRRNLVVFGITMAVLMGLSAILPAISNLTLQQSAQRQVTPEPTPVPTFPPPVDVALVRYDQRVLQQSGVFSVALPQPPDWDTLESNYNPIFNQAIFAARSPLYVLEAYLARPDNIPADAAALSTFFDRQVLANTWRGYTSWAETDRRTTAGNAVEIDFELTRQGSTYIARQRTWLADDALYSVRVVAPTNAAGVLVPVLEQVAASFTAYPSLDVDGVPLTWLVFYDAPTGVALRHPAEWTVVDSAPGRPATLVSGDGRTSARIETVADAAVTSETEATARAEALGLAPGSVAPVTTAAGLSGYQVAFSARTPDGDTTSGALLLLGSPAGLVQITLRTDTPDFDLNAVRAATPEPTPEATADPAATEDPFAPLPTPAPLPLDAIVRGMFSTVSVLPDLTLVRGVQQQAFPA